MPNLKDFLKLTRFSREKILLLIILFVLIFILQKNNFTNFATNIFPEIKSFLPSHSQDNNLANTTTTLNNSLTYKVVHVADGDTVTIKDSTGNEEIVRLLAVDSLELKSADPREKCLANLAKDFTTKTLLNQEIVFAVDPTQPKRDKYGRLLLYVSRAGEAKSFNQQLMETGLAKTYKATPPAQEWQNYENIRARMESEKRGIWDEKLCTGFTL
jgi:micrococcal nuclease